MNRPDGHVTPDQPDDRHCFPLAPLAHMMGIPLGITGRPPGNPTTTQLHGLAALAQRLGISHSWAQHLNRHGLTESQADRYAIRIGHHPSNVWDNWWRTTPDDLADDTDIATIEF